MILSKLRLQDFRNYRLQEFDFPKGLNLVVGSNAVGKTNLLEAIDLLATGHSFRANLEQEMINWQKQIGRLKGRVESRETIDLEIVLTRGEVEGMKAAKKKCLVNGVSKRMIDFVGQLKAVYFGPESLELVLGSPSLRRRYLDRVLIQIDREYYRSLASYEKGLRQRNKLLERIREGEASRSQLFFWDQLLVKNGQYLTDKREELIQLINDFKLPLENFDFKFSLEYDRSVVSTERLSRYAQEEVAAAATLVGPHRDDFRFRAEERDLSIYGSRGEQRLAVLWLKLAESGYLFGKAKEKPIILLDDIFSELDQRHRDQVLEILASPQTIITTADKRLVEKRYLAKMNVIELGR